MKRILPFLIIIAVLGVAVGSAFYLKRATTSESGVTGVNHSSPPSGSSSSSPTGSRTPVSTITAVGADPPHSLGPANAPVTLEEFGDFECPPCAQFHPVLSTMEKEFGDRIRIIFREYPLVPNHQHALAAATAAEAAGLQGKFWDMHHKLYENQKAWHEAFDVRPIFEGYAKQIGLDVEQFKRDMNSDLVARRITEDGKRGRSLNVKGTPSVFMNGQDVPFEILIDAGKLRNLINTELANARR